MLQFDDLAVGPAPQLPLATFQRRRERVADGLQGTLVVATHPETTYSNDVEPRFRPGSDFWYLTGFAEPGAVLVLEPTGRSTLFCRSRDAKAEVWTGRRLGHDRAKDALGVDAVRPIDELGQRLASLLHGDVALDTSHHPDIDEVARNQCDDPDDGALLLAEHRLRKDADEVKMLQQACDVGVAAMCEALASIRPGAMEYEVEADLVAGYRRRGSTGPGYPPIVGSGANAAVLHYIENQARIEPGDMVLIDAGCEWGYYNSDITRTAPADGRFTDAQADLYGLVRDAQQAALAKARPGNRLAEVHDAAAETLAAGLVERGWIDDPESHKNHFMHGTSHFLGLDVHDVGRYKLEGESRILEAGMVITVEPGLYANPDFAPMPRTTQPLGIRIEDDVLITDAGPRVLTGGLPTDIDGVERLVQKG